MHQERQYQTLFTEMRALLSESARPPKESVTHTFLSVYLFIKGKDWKKAVDVTSAKKVEKLIQPYKYNYWLNRTNFIRRLSKEATIEFDEVRAIIHKQMKELLDTLQLLRTGRPLNKKHVQYETNERRINPTPWLHGVGAGY